MGSAFVSLGGDPIPANSDAVLVPADFQMYADAIAHKIVHWVVDQAERDVLYADDTAPVWVASPTHLWLKISGTGGGSVWKTVWADSGAVVASTGNGFTDAADFDMTGGYVRKLNDSFVQLTVQTQRKNSTLASNSSGNISGDPIMFTLPVGYRPTVTTPGVVRALTADFVCEVDTAGVCRILSGQASYTIAVDETCVVAASFFTP